MKEDVLAPDTAVLVDELRMDAALDSAALGRLRERLAVSLTLAQLPIVPEPAAPGAPVAHGGNGLLASKLGGIALFALGAAVGAWGHALVSTKPEPIARQNTPAASVSASPALGAVLTPSLEPNEPAAPLANAPEPAPSVRSHAVPRAASSASVVDGSVGVEHGVDVEHGFGVEHGFDAEVRLLDEARQAIASNDGGHAFATLRSHVQRYPHGTLEQERSALLVKALVLMGRFAEARQAAKTFAGLYPSSMLLDSVNAAVRRIP